MSSDQTDLWEFGTGVEPEQREPHEDIVIEYRSTVITTGRDDVGIRFDEEVITELEQGLHPDSESQEVRLHLKPKVVTETGKRMVFLTATPTQNDGKFDIAVWEKDGYPTIGFPRWVVQNEELRADVENPFSGLEAGDSVVVRAVLPAGEPGRLEFYTEDTFKTRYGRIVRAIPLLLSKPSDSAGPVIDLAAGTPYQGRVFEFNVLDGSHSVFVETAKEMGKTEREVDESGNRLLGIRCDSEVFDEVKENSSLPRQTVREVRLYWSELERDEVRNMNNALAYSRDSLLYRNYDCERFQVNLPEKGEFIIKSHCSRDDYPSGGTEFLMKYSDDGKWDYFQLGSLSDTQSSPTQLFIIPKMTTRQGNTVISWGDRGNPIADSE